MYTVAVKIEGMDKRRRTTGLMHLVVGFFLLLKAFDLYNYLVEKAALKFLPFLVIGLLSLVYGAFRNRVDPDAKYNNLLRIFQFFTFVFFGIVMLQLGKRFDSTVLFIWATVTFLLIFSEKKIFAETVLKFTEQGVSVPGSYKEHLVDWNVLENVAVRHDFITLFHSDKKYLQYQVMQDLSELEVVKMNAFCREKIELVNKLIG